MTNTLALAASMLLLMTISGQAFAAPAPSNQQAVYAATTYHYHGGPKNNDWRLVSLDRASRLRWRVELRWSLKFNMSKFTKQDSLLISIELGIMVSMPLLSPAF
jgi:hypothetical protein